MNHRFFIHAFVWLATLVLVGCDGRVEHPVVFEPNLVHAMKYQIQEDLPMDEASRDAFWIVGQMFGTPDEPQIPDFIAADDELSKLVSMDHLRLASGPAEEPGRGLFRKHCVVCHGVTGNGRGATAAVQNPYPRDYRMGVFKFKSTPLDAKPTKKDLAKLIHQGIGGTAMIKIPELTQVDIKALVDYVIYLSWRGELERVVIDEAIFEGILEDSRIIDSDFGRQLAAQPAYRDQLEALGKKDENELTAPESKQVQALELFDESWEYAQNYATEIAQEWLEADDDAIETAQPPTEFPVASNYADVLRLSQGAKRDVFLASVKRGDELFRGKYASCSKCHGEQGLGNGQTTDYDIWTKDWTTRIGIKPEDRDSLIPMLARGAMEPRNAVPRNLSEGIFRGGSDSADLYRRITEGIDGSPMPSATFVAGEFEEDDVWHLINFIRSLEKLR